jgi:hypothetical protein
MLFISVNRMYNHIVEIISFYGLTRRYNQRWCGYVNKLESKYCENSAKGCNYPLTQEAFEEIKKTEEEEVKKLIAASTRALNERITELQDLIELDVRFVKEEIKTRYESRKKKEDWWNKRDPNWKRASHLLYDSRIRKICSISINS